MDHPFSEFRYNNIKHNNAKIYAKFFFEKLDKKISIKKLKVDFFQKGLL